MLVMIHIPFTKAIFDIITSHPENIEGLSETEFLELEILYYNKLNTQYIIDAKLWLDSNLKHKYTIISAVNSGDEDIQIILEV